MPWESQPSGPPRPAPAPPPVAPPASPQQMQYDVERQPGYTYQHAPVPPYQPPPPVIEERAGVDLQAIIKEAVNSAVQQNKQQMMARLATTQKAVKAKGDQIEDLEDKVEDLEGAFQGGVVTTRTFVQGAAVDIGFAALAAGATVLGPDADLFDKELWTLVGVMMLKTVIQTGMSYMMRAQVR